MYRDKNPTKIALNNKTKWSVFLFEQRMLSIHSNKVTGMPTVFPSSFYIVLSLSLSTRLSFHKYLIKR